MASSNMQESACVRLGTSIPQRNEGTPIMGEIPWAASSASRPGFSGKQTSLCFHTALTTNWLLTRSQFSYTRSLRDYCRDHK